MKKQNNDTLGVKESLSSTTLTDSNDVKIVGENKDVEEKENKGEDVEVTNNSRENELTSIGMSEVENEKLNVNKDEVIQKSDNVEISKRKRGRPRKISKVNIEELKLVGLSDTKDEEVKDTDNTNESGKRKRGRPRKISKVNTEELKLFELNDNKEEEIKEKDNEKESPSDGKRKRGRPRKIISNSNDISKRGRGRPRKDTNREEGSNLSLIPYSGQYLDNVDYNTSLKNLILFVNNLKKDQLIEIDRELLNKVSIQQKIIIGLLLNKIKESSTTKGKKDIKILWSFISSIIAKEILIRDENKIKYPSPTYTEETSSENTTLYLSNPVSSGEVIDLIKIGGVYRVPELSTQLVKYIPHRFILLDSKGIKIPFKKYNTSTNFILLNHHNIEIKPHELNGLEIDRCPGINYDYESRDFHITKSHFKWMNFTSQTKHNYIDMEKLETELNSFYTFYERNFSKHLYFEILVKLQLREGEYTSLCKAQRTSYLSHDRDELYNLLNLLFYEKSNALVSQSGDEGGGSDDLGGGYDSEDTNILPAGTIHIMFKPSELYKSAKYRKPVNPTYKDYKDMEKEINEQAKASARKFKYGGVTLPLHTKLDIWPNIDINLEYTKAKGYIKDKDKKIQFEYLVTILEDDGLHIVEVLNTKGVTVLTFKDYISDDKHSFTNFKREIIDKYDIRHEVKEIFYIEKGKQVAHVFQSEKVRFLSTRYKDESMNNKILTLDIETKTVDGKMVPVCISFYDGEKAWTRIINTSTWFDDMQKALKTIMSTKYNHHHIYIHNFAQFDALFMVDALSKLGKLSPVIRDNKIIKAKFTFDTVNVKGLSKNKTKGVLHFYDSYLILTSSLKDLCSTFKVDNPKLDFPLLFLNKANLNYNYEGEVPEYKYFIKANTPYFTLEDYDKYKGNYNTWNLKKELSKYCEQDCIALYEVVIKFKTEIFENFRVDVSNFPTLPSLAYGIYRSSFLSPDAKIPAILGKKYRDISQAYYGGITDYYKVSGRNVKSYDVNSLYPYCMQKFSMPVGSPVYFKGNPYKVRGNPFGFFYVEVECPEMKVPFLPYKNKEKKYSTTVYPIGTWSGWYFSEEIKNAEKYGYKFKIIEGILFERANIFKDFISKLYEMRLKSNRGDPKNQIAKMIMNSTYGRFGMSPLMEKHEITTPLESEKILDKNNDANIVSLPGSGNVIVSYKSGSSEELEYVGVSVSVSAAIASYARIVMSHYLVKYSDHLICCDTDGIKVSCDLDSKEVDDTKLGMMKYEYTFTAMVSPGAKMYGGILKTPYKGLNEIVKVKGVKKPISYYNLTKLLYKNMPIKVLQEIWLRKMGDSTILVKDRIYTITTNENKRELIYDSNGKIIDTLPIFVQSGREIRRNNPLLYFLPAPIYWETILLKWGDITLYLPYCKSICFYL